LRDADPTRPYDGAHPTGHADAVERPLLWHHIQPRKRGRHGAAGASSNCKATTTTVSVTIN